MSNFYMKEGLTMKDVVKNEVTDLERLIKERVESNINLFNKEEIDTIKNNKNLVSKLYLLGFLDSIF